MTADPDHTQAPARTRVKVCGITRAEDARLALGHGAWALGMILWPASPRHVKLQQAAEIADEFRRSAEVAGVFVDQPLAEVTGLANEIGLTLVQLHGSEGPQFCREVARSTGARVVKAFRVQGRDVLSEMGKFYDVDLHLLDSYRAGVPGGTGETFDWSFLTGWRRGNVPLVLSGGLTPDNVAAAIETVGPWAVDVASGVESAPGIKDPERLVQFFAAVDGAVSPRHERPEPALTGAEDEVLTLEYARRQAREQRQG